MPIDPYTVEFPEFLDFAKRKVPPSLHESIFAAPGFDEDQLIVNIRAAMREGRQAAERSLQIAAATLTDETLTEPARHKLAADNIFKTTNPALEKLQGMIDRLARKIAELDEGLKGPPKPTSATAHWEAMELRNALSGMKREDRRRLILDAIRNNDQAIPAAILRCQPFLAGLDPIEQEDFRLQWQRAAHPRESSYLATLKGTQEHIERGGKLLLDYSLSLTNSQLVQRAEKARQRTAAAMQGLAA